MLSHTRLEIHVTCVGQLHAAALLRRRQKTIGYFVPQKGQQRKSGRMKNLAYFAQASGQKRNKALFFVTQGPNHVFQDSCLVVSFCIAYLLRKVAANPKEADNRSIARKLNQLHAKDASRRNKAAQFVMEETLKLISAVEGLDYEGPHSLDQLGLLAQAHNVSVTVWSKENGNQVVYREPITYEGRIPLWFYLVPTYKNRRSHMHVIRSLQYFKNSAPCLLCLRAKSSGSLHDCPVKTRKVCPSCFRIKLKPSDYTDSGLQQYHCKADGNLIDYVCPSCNKRIDTDDCLKQHLSKVCQKFVICDKCHARVRSSLKAAQRGTSAQERLLEHDCHKISCK